jgi:1-phosphatidylinositol-3-phosphate 5-kinase
MTQPQSGIVLQSHRYKLRSYANCYVGSEIVDWLLVRDKAGGGSSRIQATALAQALMEAGHLECLSTPGERLFVDGYSLYRPVKSNQQEPELVAAATAEFQQQQQQQHHSPPPEADEEPLNWVSQHNQESKTEDPEETEEDHHHHHHQQQQQLQEDATQSPSDSVPLEEDSATQLLADLFESHIHLLMRQLLEWHGLSQTWAEVLAPLVQSLAHAIRPDVRDDDDDMDVRTYVHIKKVPGGGKMDSRIVHGVVCSKNVANRSMPK